MDIEKAKHYLRSLKEYCEITPTLFGNKTKIIHTDNLDIQAIETVLNELDKLEEYKKIAELTKISCCTAQNCEALINAIKEGLENQKLKVELDKKDKIINEMAEIIEECRQNDCLESDEIDLSEIAGKDRIIDYFTKKVEGK